MLRYLYYDDHLPSLGVNVSLGKIHSFHKEVSLPRDLTLHIITELVYLDEVPMFIQIDHSLTHGWMFFGIAKNVSTL